MNEEYTENSKVRRQREAEERQQERDQRTPEEQLAILDERLGVGVGAKRERERLAKLIANRDK